MSLLKPYQTNGLQQEPPPLEVEEELEFELDSIQAHQEHRGERQYLVSWRGYDDSENVWLAEPELVNAQEMLAQYKRAHGLD